jgi:hypothetical protein
MSEQGKARRICYAWGDRDGDALQAATVKDGLDDQFVCVSIQALYDAWQLGVALLVQEMDLDPEREARILARAAKFFDQDSTEDLDRWIERAGFASRR